MTLQEIRAGNQELKRQVCESITALFSGAQDYETLVPLPSGQYRFTAYCKYVRLYNMEAPRQDYCMSLDELSMEDLESLVAGLPMLWQDFKRHTQEATMEEMTYGARLRKLLVDIGKIREAP
jgi:hypothetical protein